MRHYTVEHSREDPSKYERKQKSHIMDYVKEKLENKKSVDLSWETYAIKQGYLIKFHRGLLKAPKMQYFVLTSSGLISFEERPHYDSKPLWFLPYEQLSSIKVDYLEFNNFKLCCMQVTSKISPNFTVAFSSKEERDEWMMIMMKAFSEALLTTPVFNKTPSSSTDEDKSTASEEDESTASDEDKLTAGDEAVTEDKLERRLSLTTKEILERTSSYGQTLRRKRRKGDKGSIRRTKSCDMLASNDVANSETSVPDEKPPTQPVTPEVTDDFFRTTRKRKSEPDVHDASIIPRAWTTESKEKFLAMSCSIEHRDTVTTQKPLGSKGESKHKSNMFARLRSMLENPTLLHAH